jgi:hypothetical protein
MALERWLFLYTAPGLPAEGRVEVVKTASCTTTLAGFPATDAALTACRAGLADTLASAQLVELCGGFASEHVLAIRAIVGPVVPVGLVTYTGDMTAALHRLFGG